MEQSIKDRFNDAILQEAMHRYAVAADAIHLLAGFESLIYEFERDSGAYILRIGHTLRRSEALIRGEVDWINALAGRGISVARAVCSRRGELVEAIEDGQGGYFLATAFVKAQGQPPWKAGWTPALYEAYGQLLGSMHALSEDYQPADPAWKRPEWDDDVMEYVERFLPASENVAKEKYRALCAHFATLPKANINYGLIHQDAHGGNLLVDSQGTITLFDFDDCVYSWYINDIAIVLFYIAMGAKDPPAFTRDFMAHFLRGYRGVRPLDARWLQEIPHFLKLREIELYAVIHRDFDVDHIDDAWCERYMHQRKYKIENDVPFIDFDFASLAAQV